MSLKQWLDNGWLRFHKTSKNEIDNLLMIVERDLKDAQKGLSDDWRFGIAYNCICVAKATPFRIRFLIQLSPQVKN